MSRVFKSHFSSFLKQRFQFEKLHCRMMMDMKMKKKMGTIISNQKCLINTLQARLFFIYRNLPILNFDMHLMLLPYIDWTACSHTCMYSSSLLGIRRCLPFSACKCVCVCV